MPTYLKRPRISIVSSENGWYTSINFPKDMAMFPSRDEAIRNLSKSLSQLLESKVDLSEVDLKTGERKLIPGGLYHILCLENSDFVAFSKQTVKRKRNGSSKKRRK